MVIIFSNEKARTHLLEKGFVYTFRKNRKSAFEKMNVHKQIVGTGIIDWATDKRGGKKIVDVAINEFGPHYLHQPGPYDIDDLEPFVKRSGFDSLREWADAILQFSPEMLYTKGWLYKVTIFKQKEMMK